MMVSVGIIISSIDIYLPALPFLKAYFQTTEYMMQISIMISPLVSALVGLFFGRLSDVHGRRPLFLFAMGLFVLGSLGCCFSWSIETFFLSRIIQAIGGGGISILAVVIISDLFHGVHYARYMGIYGALFPIAFAVAPIIGAQLLTYFGWRSTFVLLFVLSAYITLNLIKELPETLEKKQNIEGTQGTTLYRFFLLFRNRDFVLMGLGHSLPISISGLFTANGPFVFIEGFEFSPISFSIVQAIPIAICLLSAFIYQRYIPTIGIERAIKVGLSGFMLFSFFALGMIFDFLPNTPYVIIAILCFSSASAPFVVSSCATRAFEAAHNDRGLGVGLVALLRNVSFSAIVMTAGLFYNGTIIPVFIGQGLICVTVLFLMMLALHRPMPSSQGAVS